MDNYKSKVTRVISKIKDYDFFVLASEIENGLNKFLKTKLAEQGKVLSPIEKEEISSHLETIDDSEVLAELDDAIWNFEKFAQTLVNLKPGEIEFSILTHLHLVFKEVEEFTNEMFPEDRIDLEKEKKEGKVLPFKPEGGKH